MIWLYTVALTVDFETPHLDPQKCEFLISDPILGMYLSLLLDIKLSAAEVEVKLKSIYS